MLLLRMLIGALIVTVLSGGAVAAAGLLQVKQITDEFERYGEEAPLRPGTITRAESGKPQTVLLVGSDRRYVTARPGRTRAATCSTTSRAARTPPTGW